MTERANVKEMDGAKMNCNIGASSNKAKEKEATDGVPSKTKVKETTDSAASSTIRKIFQFIDNVKA